jgi:hypothetical protein
MFRRNIASAIADLTLWTDGNGKTGSTVATVGENPSAKGRLPDVYLLTKIPLNNLRNIYYMFLYAIVSSFTLTYRRRK